MFNKVPKHKKKVERLQIVNLFFFFFTIARIDVRCTTKYHFSKKWLQMQHFWSDYISLHFFLYCHWFSEIRFFPPSYSTQKLSFSFVSDKSSIRNTACYCYIHDHLWTMLLKLMKVTSLSSLQLVILREKWNGRTKRKMNSWHCDVKKKS